MIYALTFVHVVVCLFLIIVVLLQSGKGADLAGTFTGMGSQTAFGPRGAATALSRATAVAVVLFMLTSISLTIYGSRGATGSGSVLGNKPAQTAPAQPNQQTPPAQPPAPAEQPKK